MGIFELFLIGIGLSMDAFAVAICQGLRMSSLKGRDAVVIGLFFGGFQAVMPLLGWLLGSQFAGYIQRFDDWLSFFFLALIGGNMIQEALSSKEETAGNPDAWTLNYRQLLMMAVATSIDALVVGVTFSFLSVAILPAILIIGSTTFLLALIGVAAGNRFGARYQKRAEISGGILLVLLGTKILLEHLL